MNNNTTDMTCDVVAVDARTVKVTLSGELDITNIEAVASAVAPALERETDRLIIDVRDLHFADSSAIALWVQWGATVPEIELREASPLLRRVVDSMGLTDTLKVKP